MPLSITLAASGEPGLASEAGIRETGTLPIGVPADEVGAAAAGAAAAGAVCAGAACAGTTAAAGPLDVVCCAKGLPVGLGVVVEAGAGATAAGAAAGAVEDCGGTVAFELPYGF